MQFVSSKDYEKEQVENLVKDSAKIDGTEEFLKVCNDLNINDDMLPNFYAYEKDKLIGYLNVFAPLAVEAEIFAIVHPNYRNQGVFKSLLNLAKEEVEKYNTEKIIFVCNSTYLSGVQCLKHLGYELYFSEYGMKYGGAKIDEDKNIIIREANNSDIKKCVELFQGLYTLNYETAEKKVKQNIASDTRRFLIFFEKDCLIGTSSFDIEDGVATIYGVGISKEYRGQGLSKKLMRETILRIQEQGINDIRLEVDSINEIAFNLYSKLGFKIVEQIDYYI